MKNGEEWFVNVFKAEGNCYMCYVQDQIMINSEKRNTSHERADVPFSLAYRLYAKFIVPSKVEFRH